ncbi:FtsB family cell division protein [Brevibacterium ihuae]|uniref:FtsB family cell division protein n=1 Tax=Brevibacterium ihuae TaxID=1631743 RepID=UPI0015E0DE91|nr:septum formation initiator family protein [Brevibacterium ihuae]
MSSQRRRARSRPDTAAPSRTRTGTFRTTRPAPVAAVDPDSVDSTVAGRRLSGRTLALIAVAIVLIAMFAPSISTGIRQWQQISALEQDIATTEQEVEQLADKQEQLHDPEYIERVARAEQFYVRPGEKAYIVVDDTAPDTTAEGTAADSAGDRVERPVRDRPWYIELVESLTSVGYATKETAPPEDLDRDADASEPAQDHSPKDTE